MSSVKTVVAATALAAAAVTVPTTLKLSEPTVRATLVNTSMATNITKSVLRGWDYTGESALGKPSFVGDLQTINQRPYLSVTNGAVFVVIP